MSLAEFVIARKLVSFAGGSFHVKGLSLDDINFLIRDWLPEIDSLFKMYENEDLRETAISESAKFAIGIVQQAPHLVGTLIAVGAEELDMVDIARRLPIPAQVEAIKAIFELTFEEAGGAKKFLDMILSLVQQVRPKSREETA